MATPKFAAGDRVRVLARKDDSSVRPGTYLILRAMPEGNEGRQYRVKNNLDPHERVVREADLIML